jgi:hypothetical protein
MKPNLLKKKENMNTLKRMIELETDTYIEIQMYIES